MSVVFVGSKECMQSPIFILGLPNAGIILCMRPVNERRRYIIMPSLFGWEQTKNDDPC